LQAVDEPVLEFPGQHGPTPRQVMLLLDQCLFARKRFLQTTRQGIALPRLHRRARKAVTPARPTVLKDFKQIVIDYIEKRYGQGQKAAE
jgi:hypothetical protein